MYVGGAVVGLPEMQYLTVDVVGAAGFELAAYMGCDGLDIALERFHIGKHIVVDTLQHISRADKICVVDES